MRNVSLGLIVNCLILLASCSRSDSQGSEVKNVKTKQDFLIWVNDNKEKLTNSREMGDFNFTLVYNPTSEDNNQVFSFVFCISPNNNENLFNKPNLNFTSNDSKMMYWSSGIRRQLKLVTDKDTVPCSIVVYENSGMLSNNIVVNVGFSCNKLNHQKYTVVYEDVYFGMGQLNFTFDQIISNVPRIEQS